MLLILPQLIFAAWTTAVAAASPAANNSGLKTHPQQLIRAAEGSEVSFGCSAEDPAVSRLEWRFVNDSHFDLWLVSSGGRVLLPAVTFNLSGIYECVAYSGLQRIQSVFLELKVLRPVRIETFVNEVPNGTVLTCRARSDLPTLSAQWFWNGKGVDGYDVFRAKNESDNRFSLEVATENWIKGEFSCVLANDFGQNSSARFSLPLDPSVVRTEVFRGTIRLRIGKEWCLHRIEVSLSNNESVMIQCRSANPIKAFTQLISGFVSAIISPKRVQANSLYYGRAVIVSSDGKTSGPSSSFVFETHDLSSNRCIFDPEAEFWLIWVLWIGVQVL